MRVEHSIGRLKRYARLADQYGETVGRFNYEFNVATGLVNLHLLWDRIDKGPPPPGRWEMVIDWKSRHSRKQCPVRITNPVHIAVLEWCARIIANFCKIPTTSRVLVQN